MIINNSIFAFLDVSMIDHGHTIFICNDIIKRACAINYRQQSP